MPFVSRASLSQEFVDMTSAMLLLQPEPQYLHANLIKMALAAELDTPDSLGLPIAGRDGIGANGEPYASPEDSRLIIEPDPIMSEAVKVVTDFGRVPGHTVRINRPAFANTTYTQASRDVPNGSTISTTPINVSSEQVSLTLKRFGGPYDSTNSRVAPYGVDRFDASMPIHKLASVVGLHLKRDLDRWLDTVGVLLFDAASSAVYPKGMTANNDAVAVDSFVLDFEQLSRVEKTLDDANIPVYADGKRCLVLTTKQLHDLKQDSQFVKYAEFHPPVNPVLQKSYFKSVAGFHIYKSTTLRTVNNSSSVPIQYGQAFGPGMVGLGAGMLPEVRTSTADNFGEHALVAWLAYMAFGVLDNRFGVSVRSA